MILVGWSPVTVLIFSVFGLDFLDFCRFRPFFVELLVKNFFLKKKFFLRVHIFVKVVLGRLGKSFLILFHLVYNILYVNLYRSVLVRTVLAVLGLCGIKTIYPC